MNSFISQSSLYTILYDPSTTTYYIDTISTLASTY